jgi:hypothetical protein
MGHPRFAPLVWKCALSTTSIRDPTPLRERSSAGLARRRVAVTEVAEPAYGLPYGLPERRGVVAIRPT